MSQQQSDQPRAEAAIVELVHPSSIHTYTSIPILCIHAPIHIPTPSSSHPFFQPPSPVGPTLLHCSLFGVPAPRHRTQPAQLT